jgi:hypothetical protein
MNSSCFLAALTCISFGAASLSATDLTKIDRKITKEPAYKFKPKYCLLVFGPEARTRVWLVLDGDTLYVDRNCNGVLTEAGKKVADQTRAGRGEGEYEFDAGQIRSQGRTHEQLLVNVSKLDRLAATDDVAKEFLAKNPKALAYLISVEMEMPGYKGKGLSGRVPQTVPGVDINGVLQFGDRPQDAPVVHFGGPLEITFYGRQQLTRGRDADLFLAVGTAGVGPGTTAYLTHEGVIPDNAYPVLEVTYPPGERGQAPARERYELKRRC